MKANILNGDYLGYYSYGLAGSGDHEMKSTLNFHEDGSMTGQGMDDVNTFLFRGTYDLETFSVNMIKIYPTHKVNYTGVIEDEGDGISINGVWKLKGKVKLSGGFTLKKSTIDAEIMKDINAIEAKIKRSLQTVEDLRIRFL